MGKEAGAGEVKRNIANLYTLSKDRKLEIKVPNITLSNGLAWSLDNSVFYYVDTCEYRIDAFDYDMPSGDVSE
jgi:gluconolactonase